MFRFTTTITLAILYLSEPSLSRPIPRTEKGELVNIGIQLIPGLDIGVHVGRGDNIVDVNLKSMHLPSISCTNTQKSIATAGVELPLIDRNMKIKRVDPPTLPNTAGPVIAIDLSIPSLSSTSPPTSTSTSDFVGSITAKDSSIPKSSIASKSTSANIYSRRLHTHHRTLATDPPPTIIIETIPISTNRPKIKHTHHRLTKTSQAIQYTSVHPHPLPAQTLFKRLETTKSLTINSHTAKSMVTSISPSQTRFPIVPVDSMSRGKTTLGDKGFRKLIDWEGYLASARRDFISSCG
ncbi:hypothetical protein ACHAPC_003060 [Botrytis cinerea]|uniref:Uncharacterized protein n=1 Tax=Botryotinia fuckeliana (strain BcDW1) TaxID=1290391 RepID=M7TN85_BOTF1|nr:hypothetical protein BcDW1_8792 [Botrytis cinerea BcDW1]